MSARRNPNQWVETRGGRTVTVTEHPVRRERVEFYNEPSDPTTGPLTLKFYIEPGHEVDTHIHPQQTETLTVNAGRIRATIDGKEEVLEVGDHRRVPPGVPHGYEVIGEEEGILAVSMTPALSFKEFILAEHALAPDAYGDNGLNLPYAGLLARRYGPMLAPPLGKWRLRLMIALLAVIARLQRLSIPADSLPARDEDDE